jgi:CRP-like cAMP-binding protein
MKNQLKKYLNRYVRFTDSEIDRIYEKLIFETFEKKEFLVKEGQFCTNKYFIISGLTRSFYVDEKGNEKIVQFALENWWVTSMESFIKGTVSYLSIQAIEETAVLKLKKKDLESLYIAIPKLERLFRLITENMLIAFQRKNDIYLQVKSKERYMGFVNQFPDFAQRVPQYMIASYLEITPEYLSQIRKK